MQQPFATRSGRVYGMSDGNDEAARASGGTGPTAPPATSATAQPAIDAETIAQIIGTTISQLTAQNVPLGVPAPAAGPSPKSIRLGDLPKFSGHSVDGSEAQSHIESLETIFDISHTPDGEKVKYVSLSLTSNSPAEQWFKKNKREGHFRTGTDAEDTLRYDLFRTAFLSRYTTPTSRRYALEDLWDKFTQKGTVADHQVKFSKLLYQLQQLGIDYQPDIVASKYLRSLKPELFQAVCNKNRSLPEFEVIHAQAVEAEYHFKSNRGPAFQGLFPQGGAGAGKKFWCELHKENRSHDTKDCNKIKELKKQGKWKENENQK